MDRIFTFRKLKTKNKIKYQDSFEFVDDKHIIGLYLDNCIRFYKHHIDFDEIDKSLNRRDPFDLYKSRVIYGDLDDFSVNDNYVKLTINNYPSKFYNFENGIITAENEYYLDVIEQDRLKEYLDKHGFDEENIEFSDNKNYETKRNENKKLTYTYFGTKLEPFCLEK